MNYGSPSKQTWRGWIWNRITERIPKLLRKDAIILYLVGPDDLDREVALKKGFRNHNLIAVDIDLECVERVRKSGNLAIQGRIEDILVAWPDDWPIAAVLADFTCGLDKTLIAFQSSLLICRSIDYGHTVIGVNLQRGRDPASNPMRQGLRDAIDAIERNIGKSWKSPSMWKEGIVNVLLDGKHRGKQLITNFMFHAWNSIKEHYDNVYEYARIFIKICNPAFYSYRQAINMPYMDSVVFTMPPGMASEYNLGLEVFEDISGRDALEIKGRIAALRAVRTMKMKGIL
jgi:hypothetical protein